MFCLEFRRALRLEFRLEFRLELLSLQFELLPLRFDLDALGFELFALSLLLRKFLLTGDTCFFACCVAFGLRLRSGGLGSNLRLFTIFGGLDARSFGRTLRFFARDAIRFALRDRSDTSGFAFDALTNTRFFGFLLLANALLFARNLRKPTFFDFALGSFDRCTFLGFDARLLRFHSGAETRVTSEVRRTELQRVLAARADGLTLHRVERARDLEVLLDLVVLCDPRGDVWSRCRRIDRVLLNEQLNHRVIDDGRRILERDHRRAARHKWRNVRETIEVRTLILAREIPQMIERRSVLPTENVVECRAKPRCTLLDERILLTDRLDDFPLEHHAQFIRVDDEPRESAKRLLREFRRAFPKQEVGQQDRKWIVGLVPW